jgi:hypothetical protein
MTKRRTAPEIIGIHLCWDMRDVSEGRYQRYSSPAVYACGSDYYCAPTTNQKPPLDYQWDVVGEYFGRKVYIAT